MQALGRHDMVFHKTSERIERRADRPHGVGHGRQRDRRAFQSVALGLAVQGLMLTELLEHDHGQEAGSPPSPRDDMERRRRLRDLFAVAAGVLLPLRLDHFPPAGPPPPPSPSRLPPPLPPHTPPSLPPPPPLIPPP